MSHWSVALETTRPTSTASYYAVMGVFKELPLLFPQWVFWVIFTRITQRIHLGRITQTMRITRITQRIHLGRITRITHRVADSPDYRADSPRRILPDYPDYP